MPGHEHQSGLFHREAWGECRLELVAAGVLGLASVPLSLVPAIGAAIVLDRVIHAQAYATLIVVLVLLLIFYAAETAISYIEQRLKESAAGTLAVRAQQAFLGWVRDADLANLERIPTARLQARYTAVASYAQAVVEWRSAMAAAPLAFVVISVVLASFSVPLTAVILLVTAAYAVTHAALAISNRRAILRLHRERDVLAKRVHEAFSAIDVARTTNSFDFFFTRVGDAHELARAAGDRVSQLTARQAALGLGYQRIVLAAILGIGALQAIGGALSVGQLVMANMLARQLAAAVRRMSATLLKREAAAIELENINTTLGALRPRERSECSKSGPGVIRANAIGFRYPDQRADVFSGLSLQIPSGSLVAIVGPSGCGKSTLLKLLAGLYEPSSGSIRFEQSASFAELRHGVGYLGQGDKLFGGTVHENVALNRRQVSEQDVRWACQAAEVDEFIGQLHANYRHKLAHFGQGLSGGQRQRLALARTLAGRPPYLFLDEPTSALDERNKEGVLSSLLSLRGKTTIVVTTHDQDVMTRADLVINLDRSGG